VKKLSFYYLEIIIISLTIIARVVPGPRTVDDAYITFRYAQNIIAGNGMVYNPGERVLGTTTPIYSFTMAIFGSITGGVDAPYPWISLLVNTFADALTAILLIRLGQSLGHRRAGYATAFIWSIAPIYCANVRYLRNRWYGNKRIRMSDDCHILLLFKGLASPCELDGKP